MTGWKGSSRRDALPPDWHITQPRILARDGHQCQHIREDSGRPCADPARDVDHIVPHSQGGSDDDSNLRALCPWHHNQKSGREGGLASGLSRRTKAAKAKPKHPGLTLAGPEPVQRKTALEPEGPAPF